MFRRNHLVVTVAITVLALFAIIMVAGCKTTQSSESAEADQSSAMPADDVAEPSDEAISTEPFYILVCGDDTRDGTVSEGKGGHGADGHSRTDTMLLIRVAPANYSIALISVPRDTRTDLDGWIVKLNQSYDYGGMDEVVEQVELLTGADVRYWFRMKLADFMQLIDGLGGVDVDVPIAMDRDLYVTGERVVLEPGYQHLNGAETSILVQHRLEYGSPADASRQIQTRKVVEWCIRHVAEMGADEAEVSARLLLSLSSTNMPADEYVALVRSFAGHAGDLSVVSCSGPYDGDIDPETELWLAYRDEDTWREIIAAVEEGRDPTEILPIPDVWAE